MRHLLASAVVLLTAQSSWGSDAEAGERLYRTRCASCHTAARPLDPAAAQRHPSRPLPKAAPRVGPDLVAAFQSRPADFSTWIEAPWKKVRDTACQTRGLSEMDKDALQVFLAGATRPEAPAQEELLRRNLREGLKARTERERASHRIEDDRGTSVDRAVISPKDGSR